MTRFWPVSQIGARGDFEKGRKEIPGPRNWLNAVELEQVAADDSLVFTRENRIFATPKLEKFLIDYTMEKDKDLYEAPTILVVEAKTEGIICASKDGYDPIPF